MGRLRTCKFCGKTADMDWRKVGDNFLLVDMPSGQWHFENCTHTSERTRVMLRSQVASSPKPSEMEVAARKIEEIMAKSEPKVESTATMEQVASRVATAIFDHRKSEFAAIAVNITAEVINESETRILDALTSVANDAAKTAIENLAPRVIEIHDGDKVRTLEGRQHMTFPQLIDAVSDAKQIGFGWPMLVGPAASGKTTAAHKLAEALDVPYYEMSCWPTMDATDFSGYVGGDAKTYHRTAFREAYETGGIFMADEGDAGSDAAWVWLNSAVGNGHCRFPDGAYVARHKDFAIVIGANTFGQGADRVYSARKQLDGATLDRFAVIEWLYDEDAEMSWAPVPDWTRYVQKCRHIAMEHKLRVVISPRASIAGGNALNRGRERSKVEEMYLWKGISSDARELILSNLR